MSAAMRYAALALNMEFFKGSGQNKSGEVHIGFSMPRRKPAVLFDLYKRSARYIFRFILPLFYLRV